MNLLNDPIFRIELRSRTGAVLNLPEVFEALGKNDIDHFSGIQRHQEEAFHVFLSYLGGAVLAREGLMQPRQSTSFWRDGLRRLVGDYGDQAWSLVGENLAQPAFMQPPLPSTEWSKLRVKAETPDEMDLLVTAKDHDVKIRRARVPEADNWVYALISLQTMAGFSGRGQTGISRMNGGFGNRLVVEVVRSFDPGQRWCDAVTRILQFRAQLLEKDYGYRSDGLVLVWLWPWDGETTLPLSALDPFYIEICRRVRLKLDPTGRIVAEGLPSKRQRIDAKELLGAVGDPWLPVDVVKDRKALRSHEILTYDLLAIGIDMGPDNIVPL